MVRTLPRSAKPSRRRLAVVEICDDPYGRYFAVQGRLWRASNPALKLADRATLENHAKTT